jgi:integrase/recombinase XerD
MTRQRDKQPENVTTIADLFELFCQHGQFLRNWSPKTLASYRQAFRSLQSVANGSGSCVDLTKACLESWVVSMRQRGLSGGACNAYIRAMNSWLSWLASEGYVSIDPLRLMRTEQRAIQPFAPTHVSALLAWRANRFSEIRLHALVETLLDTGCRIEELLTAHDSGVDLENLLLTVVGKGSKERRVPFSLELRKTLFRFLKSKAKRGILPGILFASHSGGRISYRNTYRDIRLLCERLGISGPRLSPHTFRHTFATNFLRQGGDVYKLCRVLGHTDIRTTMRYLHLTPEDLREHQQRSSLLRRSG